MTVTLKNHIINTFTDGTPHYKWVTSERACTFRAVKATRGEVINEELLDFYAYHTDTDPTIDVESSDYLIFSGVIVKGTVAAQEDQNPITLECKDRSVIVMDRLVPPKRYARTENWTAPLVVQNLIWSAAGNLSGLSNLAYSTTGTLTKYGPWLVDARLFSEAIVDTGTTSSASTGKLIDTGQNFLTTVDKGDYVRNTTNNTYAYVASVDDNENLTLSKDIMGSGDGYQISEGFIQDTRPDGSEFPFISFSQPDKPVTEGVESLSSIDYTNSGTEVSTSLIVKRSARYFIDNENRFHWYIPSDTPELVMEWGATGPVSPDLSYHKIVTFEMTNEADDNINFIVFRAGYDMNDEMIRYFARAPYSGQPNTKESRRDWLHISRNMKNEDLQKGNITFVSGEIYDYPASYPMTPEWGSASVANDSQYNTAFKAEAITRARAKCQAIFSNQANPRWKGTIQLRGEYVKVGDLIQFTSKPHGLVDILVRVTGVTQMVTDNVWQTQVNVEEDENESDKVVGG
jgi:hypothetical protein